MIRRVWSRLPWVRWWRNWLYFWGPAVAGNDQLSSDRISDRTDRKAHR